MRQTATGTRAFEALVAAAELYHLNGPSVHDIVDHQIEAISENWDDVCDAAELTMEQRGWCSWAASSSTHIAFSNRRRVDTDLTASALAGASIRRLRQAVCVGTTTSPALR